MKTPPPIKKKISFFALARQLCFDVVKKRKKKKKAAPKETHKYLSFSGGVRESPLTR